VADINAIIGLGVSFPASQFEIRAPQEKAIEYRRLYSAISQQLEQLSSSGIYISHLNSHTTIEGLWGWAITSISSGRWGDRRRKVWDLYSPTLTELAALREIVSAGADTRGEILRELRESRHRANELFVVMADRTGSCLSSCGKVSARHHPAS
jgi:hypothetical protein